MTSEKYWARRRQALLNKSIDEIDKEIYEQYLRLFKDLGNKIIKLYGKMKDSGIATANDMYQYNNYWQLFGTMQNKLNELGAELDTNIHDALYKQYIDNWELLNKQGKSTGFLLTSSPNEERITRAINEVWCSDGKQQSTRIQSNTGKLRQSLTDGLVDCLGRGASSKELAQRLSEEFNTSIYNAKRIASTELAHIQNESAIEKYEEAGIEKYTILCEPDACDECKELATKEFNITEVVIPAHPHCRCCTVAIFDKNK